MQDLLRRTGEELKGFEEALRLVRRREKGLALCEGLEKSGDPAERAALLQELRDLL